MSSIKCLIFLFLLINCLSRFDTIEVDYDYDYDKSDKIVENHSDESPLELPSDMDLIDVEHPTNFTDNIRDLHKEFNKDNEILNTNKSEILEKLMKNPIIKETVLKLREKFGNFSQNIKWNLKSFIEESRGVSETTKIKITNTLVAFIESMELSPLCLMSFVMMKRGLSNKEMWPLRYFDSMDLQLHGVLEGRFSNFGQYDECLNIENEEFKGLKMKGQYCLAKIPAFYMIPIMSQKGENVSDFMLIKKRFLEKVDLPNELLKLIQAVNYFPSTFFRFGICIPSTCSPKEIHRAITKIISPQVSQTIEIERECKIKGVQAKKNGWQRTAQSIIMTLVILVIISTSVEMYYNLKGRDFGRRKVIKKSLLVFSAISNTKVLFKKDKTRLRVVDTILLLFISLEFLGRTYIQPVFYNFIGITRANKGITKEYFKEKHFFWIRNSSFSMTIFILMSSIVLGYKLSAHKMKSKYSPIHYLRYVFNRYLSLLRRIIGPLLLIYLLPLWTNGPIWHYLEPIHVKPCKDNLLASLFFFNNYMPGVKHLCNLPSATFSTIFQLQVFAPFVLLLLSGKVFGYITLGVLVVIGCILSISRRLFLDFMIAPWEVTKMYSISEISHSFVYYLGSTEQNISTFIIGLIWGYLIQKKPNLKTFGRNGNLVLWVLFFSLPQIASYWGESFKALEGNFNTISFLIWFAIGRVLWSLGYGWIVYACSTNRGGIINRILSFEALQPLSRLAFGIYLNHVNIISIRLFAIKDTYLLTHSVVFESAFIDYLLAIFVAYFFFIIIECPVYHLIKIISGQNVNDVITTDLFVDNNEDTVQESEENIEIKLFTNTETIEL